MSVRLSVALRGRAAETRASSDQSKTTRPAKSKPNGRLYHRHSGTMTKNICLVTHAPLTYNVRFVPVVWCLSSGRPAARGQQPAVTDRERIMRALTKKNKIKHSLAIQVHTVLQDRYTQSTKAHTVLQYRYRVLQLRYRELQ